ncbi:anoctamin-5-like [Artemia franciscana]|uniref:anoctamin-5-like n=1 Tax=Artemia franciscana TaxID=6661 RepID=UPI0032DBB32C
MGSDFQVDEWLEETLKMLEDSDSIPGIIVDKGVFNTLEDVMTRSSRNSSINQCHIDGCCFRDGKRRIDMVLAYTDKSVTDEMHLQRRSVFESELQKQGLELELEDCVDSFDGKTYYLKIHAPWNFLLTQAEAVELKMPLKQKEDRPKTAGKSKTTSTNILKNKAPQKKNPYTAIFSLSKLEQFDIRDEDSFFSQTQRHFLVWHVLSKALYDENVSHRAGIRLLLAKETYIAAFPLHDGPYEIDSDSDESEASCSGLNERQILQEEWSRPGAFFKTQPYENIRRYFGDETGLYFSWLGFYTMMLVPASVAGLIAFLYGAFTLDSDSNVTSKEICGNEKDLTMCPLCDQVCPYWKLGDSCLFSKISYTFDNPATVVFAVFMSFWATILLELWKRRQAKIRWEWDLLYPQQLEDEEVRPEYEKSANGTRISPITGEEEPYVKPSSKNLRYFLSITGVLLIGAALVMAMLGVIIYRITIVIVFFKTEEGFVKQYAKLLTSITASLISLVVIQLLNWIGKMLAKYLTDLEAHRTQAEYDEKYTIKIWFFEFINDYSLLIYIALFKGRFYTYPGDPATKADIVSRLRTDQCDPAGCLSEIFIQLAIIMVGKQLLNNFLEILLPFIQNSWKLKRAKNSEMQKENAKGLPQWEKDLLLKPASRDMLQSEYLELAAQYGFVTLFVAAFPLAPLFALINCIIEIRVDAFKLVAQFRRPVPIRIADMGIWQEVIKSLTYLAVIVNAFVIAYTSEFIPRIVYYYTNDFDNDGYIRSTLSCK